MVAPPEYAESRCVIKWVNGTVCDLYLNAAAKSLQSCPTLCNPIDGSPPDSPHPWDSPGKNTGVGCHFLLQCMKVKNESEVKVKVTQSCPTLCNPIDYTVHGILQARILEWVAFPCP